MCNAYGLKAPLHRIAEDFADLAPLFADSNLEPRDLFRPTNSAPVLRPRDPANPAAGLELAELRWWLVPFFHKRAVKDWKAMCTNAKAETIDVTPTFREAYKRRRCIVPASHFFEWSGPLDPEKPKGLKQRWRVTAHERETFYFAGLWDTAHPSDHDGPLHSFTLATCAPGEDIQAYHHRQPVILDAAQAIAWLDLDGRGKALLEPSTPGTLSFAPDQDAITAMA